MRYNLRRPDGAPFDLNLTKLGGGAIAPAYKFNNSASDISTIGEHLSVYFAKSVLRMRRNFYFCCLAGKARIRPNTIVSKLIADNQYDACIT